ncbi:uncharacterized protein KD926_002150 [Aspergillus affinis]|uniref:uncharacterized protein n=1 Tax=Aspergillus affinis TaxID=1070780 RepID=UPI0022FE306A|nr:uncharacterized protein KD926_002150 [Aspergillus affinis]KAI9036241.1 hypothetical protein KD926_002150 [Aspergillus affinis]
MPLPAVPPAFWTAIQVISIVLPMASSLITDEKTRRAAAAQEAASEATRVASERTARTQEALHEQINTSHWPSTHTLAPRTFEIPQNGFNAGPEFTTVFAASIFVGAALAVRTGNELKGMGLRLGEIGDELGAQTTAKMQGWETKGFGAFIYWFLENEIHDHGGEASVGHHAFYVYNPTTSANVVFKKMVREKPLPASFGGFSSDIEGLFHLMWENRQSLYQKVGRVDAEKVQFHLLVPAKRAFIISDLMAIDDGIGRLIIKGHAEEGIPYTWFNFVCMPRQVVLQDVGNLAREQTENEFSNDLAHSCLSGDALAALMLPSWANQLRIAINTQLGKRYVSPRILGPSRKQMNQP